jgi:cell division protein FtsI/penicillin-binding protein 2
VVKAAYDADGNPLVTHTPQVLRRAIAPEVAHQLNLMLRNVVMTDEGTGAKARVDGFLVAGKTGTAQMVNPENGTYYQNRHVSSFVGFLPADDPRLLILVVLYDVGHEHFGGLVAAPVFSEIASDFCVGPRSHDNVGAVLPKEKANPSAAALLCWVVEETGTGLAEARRISVRATFSKPSLAKP